MSIWIKGALAAFITSAAGALTAAALDPDHFSTADIQHLGLIALISGVVGLAAYLKQSPIPQ